MRLPPLPEPGLVCNLSVYYGIAVNKTVLDPLFGTDQMRDYGALCRKMALEEAAGICDDISTQHNDTYKHKPGPNAYDPHYQGLSMGADECSEAIGGLK